MLSSKKKGVAPSLPIGLRFGDIFFVKDFHVFAMLGVPQDGLQEHWVSSAKRECIITALVIAVCSASIKVPG